MTARSKRRPPPVGAAAVIPEAQARADLLSPIIERPDGYYWMAADGRQQFGPFASHEEARADRDRDDEAAPEPGESLQEAEWEIGIADWIDPDTGAPAEGQSKPHLALD